MPSEAEASRRRGRWQRAGREAFGRQRGTRNEALPSRWRRIALTAYHTLAVEGDTHPTPVWLHPLKDTENI